MKHRLLAWSQKIVSPIAENPVFFIFTAIILYLPTLIYGITNFSNWLRSYGILAMPIICIVAYTLATMAQLSGRHKRSIKAITYTLLYFLSAIEVFLIVQFSTLISPLTLRLLSETNPTETYNFFITFITNRNTGFIICIFGLIAFVNYHCEIHIKSFSFSQKIAPIISCIIICAGAVQLCRDYRFTRHLLKDDINQVANIKGRYKTQYTSLGRLLFSCRIFQLSFNDIDNLAATLEQHTPAICPQPINNVILIIGESFIKHHSSLYGYRLDTNPLLYKECQTKNLAIFNDVITSHNATSDIMKRLFSFSNQDSDAYWTTYSMFPKTFISAGYKSYFLSNQEAKLTANTWDFANTFLISPKVVKNLFHWQNERYYKYDSELIEKHLDWLCTATKTPKLLTIHLIGQHVGFAERYDHSNARFTTNEYEYRQDLNSYQKECVMHYDNATAYNDQIVHSIIERFKNEEAIIIYLSDHGEEVYDYRDLMGRSHEPIVTPERAKYQFEIPFMIWMSDKYKQNRPDMVARIERSVDRPYMIDDLPHLMLDLAGIECEWFDPTRSIINDKFNAKRKRLLLDSKQDYDEIMKGAK